MPPLGMATSLGLGAPRAATSSGSVPAGADYDEDAQAYFTALDATEFTPPADYDDKKTAISNYFTSLKEDPHNNFTDIKAMYIPIWRDVLPNAINAVNPGTYNLIFYNTVTQAPLGGGEYIYGDGEATNGGYALTGFHGAGSSNVKFFEEGSASAGCNAVNDPDNYLDAAFGFYVFMLLYPRYLADTCGVYWTTTHPNVTNLATDGTKNGLWTLNSIPPGAGKTSKAELWRDGSSVGTTTAQSTTAAGGAAYNTTQMALMARMHWNGAAYSESATQFNFWFFGTEISDMDEFNTDTATMLAAI